MRAAPGTDAPSDDRQRYEILRVINRGGMGEIALGRVLGAKGFEKLVILKRLREDAEREDHRSMFDVEAELMSRIEHPNIVPVFDQPHIGGVQYLAMAYVRGRNLDQLNRRIRQQGELIAPQLALTVMSEVLRGLAFVHRLKDGHGRALGVVHQDITPSNILVSFFGEVKITDFGIAYVTSRDGGQRKGVLKGKPRYVAPEVLAGKRVNNRADLYGVAVVLYELLSGAALFARPTVPETLSAVAKGELPDFKRAIGDVSDGVHKILRRALARDPNDRYRTAEEMHADLTEELMALGGPLSAARLGYELRRRFHDAPDLPETDPAFDQALAKEVVTPPRPAPAPLNLEETLSEIDRLLGDQSLSELFDLPPDVERELHGLGDMDPFDARTPIPELALSGPNGEELLMKAMLREPMTPPPLFREPEPASYETRPAYFSESSGAREENFRNRGLRGPEDFSESLRGPEDLARMPELPKSPVETPFSRESSGRTREALLEASAAEPEHGGGDARALADPLARSLRARRHSSEDSRGQYTFATRPSRGASSTDHELGGEAHGSDGLRAAAAPTSGPSSAPAAPPATPTAARREGGPAPSDAAPPPTSIPPTSPSFRSGVLLGFLLGAAASALISGLVLR